VLATGLLAVQCGDASACVLSPNKAGTDIGILKAWF